MYAVVLVHRLPYLLMTLELSLDPKDTSNQNWENEVSIRINAI